MDPHANDIRVVWHGFERFSAGYVAVIQAGADGHQLSVAQLANLSHSLKGPALLTRRTRQLDD